MSIAAKKRFADPKNNTMYGVHRLGIEAPFYGHRHSQYAKDRISATLTRRKFSLEHRRNISLAHTQLWKDPKFVKKVFKGLHTYPNKSEQTLGEILQGIAPKEYKYNGNFNLGVSIDGLVPDFMNVNGQKKVIDLHGEYWHKGEDTKLRSRRYAKCGYHSLIVWESELKNPEVLQDKLIEFLEVK
jgi:G:T-mismatch repair DNA endonuclease (very short patch repair protein)